MLAWMEQLFENHENKRNSISAAISGVLFFSAWWLIIDVAAAVEYQKHFDKTYYICGILGTLALFMINAISNAQLRGEGFSNACLGPWGARMWIFIGFGMGFGAVIAGGWILFQNYVIPNRDVKWPGIAIFLQNFLVFASTLVYKFGRREDSWDM